MNLDEFIDHEILVRDVIRQYLPPPQLLPCADWADTWRKIAKGPEKGAWRTSRTPYLREPMNCTDSDSPVQRIVMMFATQLGKSEVGYNAVLKRIHTEPMDMLFVQPTLQDAKDHSSQRFSQTIKAMPYVQARIAEVRSRDETNTLLTKEIADGTATLYFGGANSARSLASKPLPFAFCDEIDGYPGDVDQEGAPLELVWQRLSNFQNRKMLLCSTPTLKDSSLIESEYEASDQRRYFVPCPHCLVLQTLEWGATKPYGIKWLKTDSGEARPETAVYVCQHCGVAFEERHKTQMLEDGQWVAARPGAARGLVAGFQLSKLYSPIGWRSWAELVDDWVKAQAARKIGDKTKLKTFINTSLAETWDDDGERTDASHLEKRAPDIPLGIVHWPMYVCTLGVDVQDDRLEAYKWAWGRGTERQLVDFKVFHGDPALDEDEAESPWTDLTAWRRAPTFHASGRISPILACFIDSGGHNTQAVYAYARSHRKEHVHAVKGQSIANKTVLGTPTLQDVNWRGVKRKKGAKLWPIGTDTAKSEIYGRLRVEAQGPGYVWLSKQLPQEVFRQLTAEKLVTEMVKGRPKLVWKKPAGRRNEALDCAVYALAAAHYVELEKWTHQWMQWETLFGVPAEDGKTPETTPHPSLPQPAPPPLPHLLRRERPRRQPTRDW
ncbi:MAG: phage terminase large subunit family protein [Steroidobacteraceae bacterium]|jgi:phage terminase large subunit GpA-like protein|nr:phage terminase large subunit family protein [Rubrivivax sp.]MBP7610372.1 phage terminase large subunit family protein [Steroidobacteraceae bacterium]MBP8898168.1 phage terminase large subunit family protein [Sulfuritalea sp.]